jgi:3-methyl-2-oxobutanoate hydroxymethyltransferase
LTSNINKNQTKLPVKRTVPYILQNFEKSKIIALTAYDYSIAALLDSSGVVDIILVGDSAGTVLQGHETTLPVTMEQMIYHTQCVSRAVKQALVVADLPFLSYQASIEQAVLNAGRMLKEGGASAVKLEGGSAMKQTILRLTELDIPVVGHIGLTPQSYHRMGGHKIQGKKKAITTESTADKVFKDAIAVEEAGAFALVLEGVPAGLAKEITAALTIPTIGIGAGSECNGQILVINDLLGLNPEFKPRFAKRYRELGEEIKSAVMEYAADVKENKFPAEEHSFLDSRLKVAIKAF